MGTDTPYTGEEPVLYTVTNHAPSGCTLDGYPEVTFFDVAGKALPFRYVHHQAQYTTDAPPRRIGLPPGATAYFLVAKYRCDLGEASTVSKIRISLTATGPAITEPTSAPGASTAAFAYCKGGTGDHGQIVDVSPFEPTAADTQGPPE